MRTKAVVALTILVTSLAFASNGDAVSAGQPCGALGAPPARYDHVVWIWMENHQRSSVIGSRSAPYETALAAKCATATDYRSVGSPSLPNYIGATSGGTQGVSDDGSPSSHPLTVDNLFRQVRSSGRSARTYAEAMPGVCVLGSRGRYAVKHNPGVYFQGASDRRECAHENVPLGGSAGPFATAVADNELPTLTVLVPDLCNDTHDCAVDQGDRWLSWWLGMILGGPTYHAGRTAVFVVWDEMTPMPFVAVAPTIHHGTVVTIPIDHYALLRTTEELLGIRTHLGTAATAPSLRGRLGI